MGWGSEEDCVMLGGGSLSREVGGGVGVGGVRGGVWGGWFWGGGVRGGVGVGGLGVGAQLG